MLRPSDTVTSFAVLLLRSGAPPPPAALRPPAFPPSPAAAPLSIYRYGCTARGVKQLFDSSFFDTAGSFDLRCVTAAAQDPAGGGSANKIIPPER